MHPLAHQRLIDRQTRKVRLLHHLQAPDPDLRYDLAELSRTAPQRAGDLCYRLFCRPELSSHRSPDHARLSDRARVHLRAAAHAMTPTPTGPVATYTFTPEQSPTASFLAVHGWTSEGAFMAAFVGPLLQRGARVVTFDMPAHGRSGPMRASLIDCARALDSVMRHHGPFDGIFAHSMGCLAAGLALEARPPVVPEGRPANTVAKLALIASPNRLADVTDGFASEHGLTPAAARAFARRVSRTGGRDLATVSTARLLKGLDADILLVHCRSDAQVPFTDSEHIVGELGRGALQLVDDLGHRRILYAPPVVRRVRDWLMA